jgi:hypothetical protein
LFVGHLLPQLVRILEAVDADRLREVFSSKTLTGARKMIASISSKNGAHDARDDLDPPTS